MVFVTHSLQCINKPAIELTVLSAEFQFWRPSLLVWLQTMQAPRDLSGVISPTYCH